jgi:hypothetical protein
MVTEAALPAWFSDEMIDELAKSLECGTLSNVAVVVPRQSSRRHLSMLLVFESGHRVFVKLNPNHQEADTEAAVLTALDGRCGSYRTPKVVGCGILCEHRWVALSSIPRGRHIPATRIDIEDFEKGMLPLGDVLKTEDPELFPAHRDLAPWNVRQVDGETWILDWSEAGVEPVGYDALYFDAAATVTLGRRFVVDDVNEAARERVERVLEERVGRAGARLDRAMFDHIRAVGQT